MRNPHGHTWKIEIITERYPDGLDELQQEINHSFLLNVKDRILIDVFKANGFKVHEFNEEPNLLTVAEWIAERLKESGVRQLSIGNIIYIP